ncbi:MAG: superoxide dismutase, partial [Oscillospiraceae bacterium]|nr:superoxide dismutase [Oscillospiraceae bacterium]
MNYDKYYPFKAEDLSYALNALEPYISEYTMYFHHDKHYMNYLNKLNELLKDKPLMQNIPLEGLTKIDDKDISTNAGGVYNHELFFSSVSPRNGEPAQHLRDKISKSFGSVDELEEKLIEAGKSVVGSGWVWLALDKNGDLVILTTPNQSTIDFDKYTPLLIIDVW